ncbi:NAD(P)H-dependent oxidoreductase [Flavobacterium agricola]|uniref:NAD(P)H-dependent oxidoreductase n=1 Tax=Flavobacterium agricola TaxID=2870839 RepID=A0ABY6LZ48_9FLAO|nr:NAD(P)H-dependent oxidoreductase [Flavobacterium agricola]UYW00430.1 NAD(P)H-dependent oxidoreductase [Flavobacterium agricola]
MNILVFGASTSKTSINQQLAIHVANKIENATLNIIDLNDFEMPIYSFDRQAAGFPEQAHEFLRLVKEADGIVVSLAEHNLNFSTAFKNILDWVSRIDMEFLKDKKMFVLSTSPGGYGGGNVMEVGLKFFGFAKGEVVENYSFPSFYENFKDNQIINSEIDEIVNEKVKSFTNIVAATLAK